LAVKEVNEKYRCNICGNEVIVTKVGGGTLVCCGEEMELIEPKKEESVLEEGIEVGGEKKTKEEMEEAKIEKETNFEELEKKEEEIQEKIEKVSEEIGEEESEEPKEIEDYEEDIEAEEEE